MSCCAGGGSCLSISFSHLHSEGHAGSRLEGELGRVPGGWAVSRKEWPVRIWENPRQFLSPQEHWPLEGLKPLRVSTAFVHTGELRPSEGGGLACACVVRATLSQSSLRQAGGKDEKQGKSVGHGEHGLGCCEAWDQLFTPQTLSRPLARGRLVSALTSGTMAQLRNGQ